MRTPRFKPGDKIAYNSEGMKIFEAEVADYYWVVDSIEANLYYVLVGDTDIVVPAMIDLIDDFCTLWDSPENIWLRL